MAKDAWTTGEVEVWLLNDESLYEVCMRLASRARLYGPSWLRARLRARCENWARDGALGELNVTAMRVVDWEVVVETMREAAKEPEEKDDEAI